MRWFRGERNTRFGIGANFVAEEIGTEGASTANFIRFRFGSERFQDFGKKFKGNNYRWRAFYGGDSKFNIEYASISSSDLNSLTLDFGGAPIFGILYRINERLSLSTELAYDILISFQDSGELKMKFATQFIAPRSIFVNYEF